MNAFEAAARQLISKWRAEADIVVNDAIPSRREEYNAANRRCLNRCADELEAKLLSRGQLRQLAAALGITLKE